MINKLLSNRNYKKVLKGFTLLEVMVVISIVSILAGLLIPKFVGYENKAKTIKAINTGKQIYNAVMCAVSGNAGSVTVTDISDSVKELTGIDVKGTDDVTKTDDGFKVKFASDNIKYILTIVTSDGSYTVNDGNKNIFSQGTTQN